jgi:3-phenylpropionate/trans-cinnamate dioxygenase ferredoxin component
MTTTRLCSVDDVPSGTAERFVVGQHPLCVVRLGEDWYVIGDICSHAEVSLSEGEVDPATRQIECWKHGSSFSLATGQPDSLPATRPVPTYRVRIDGDDVLVEIP